MFKALVYYSLGAITMYASLVIISAYDALIHNIRTRRSQTQINQEGGDGDDTFNNITINIPDGKSNGKR